MIRIIGINELPDYWGKARPFLERALDFNSEIYLEDVLNGILAGEYLLMVAEDDGIKAAFVAEIVEKPRKRICNLMLCGGDGREDWLPPWLQGMAELARSQHCDSLYAVGRPGWKKVLMPFGFVQIGAIYEQELSQ